MLECADLDEALAQAARFLLARYGSVEVRPVATCEPERRRDRLPASYRCILPLVDPLIRGTLAITLFQAGAPPQTG